MTRRSDALLLWAPRVLGVGVCLFLNVFALDASSGDKPVVEQLQDSASFASWSQHGRLHRVA